MESFDEEVQRVIKRGRLERDRELRAYWDRVAPVLSAIRRLALAERGGMAPDDLYLDPPLWDDW